MTKDLENRVLNDKELNEYLQHLAKIREIPPEYKNYDKNNKPVFDINKYYDVKAYQDSQEPEIKLTPIEYALKEREKNT